jgi:DNA-binding transcriptional LysR family regulator
MSYDGRLLAGVTVLMAVVEAGSMTRAAETLQLTPSGVGRAIQRLESRVGARLLDRTTRAMRLTDQGRRFWERVGPLLDGIEEAAQEAAGSAQVVRGRLRVNVDPFFSQLVLARELARFLAEHREIRIELIMRDQVGDLVADGFDLALRFGVPSVESFIVRKLFETRILMVASPAYVATRGRPGHPNDLLTHDCIDYRDPTTGGPFDWEFHRGGEIVPVAPPARLMVSDVETMLEACVAGAGIAQVMALGSEHLLHSGELIELLPDWPDETFPLYAIFPSRHYRAAKVRVFIDFCLQLLGARDERVGRYRLR